MKYQNKNKITGKVEWQLINEMGILIDEGIGENLVVDTGGILIAKALAEDSFTAPTHMAIGSDDTAVDAGDTTLGSELGRVALDSTTRADNEVEYVGTFPAGTGTGTVEEAGIFNAGSGGELLAHFLTGTITKGASDSLVVTWTLTIGS